MINRKYKGYINCFRCGEPIHHAGAHNSYYIMGEDTIEDEERERVLALKDIRIEEQKFKKEKDVEGKDIDVYVPAEDLPDDDAGFEAIDVTRKTKIVEDKLGKRVVTDIPEDTVRVVARVKMMPVQKTGIVCPNCVDLENDTLLWGVGE